jgi:vacuolar-type H+-ATPase subunit F/Vma7
MASATRRVKSRPGGSLIAVIGDEDTATGFLLAGVGENDASAGPNYFVVDSSTSLNRFSLLSAVRIIILRPRPSHVY